MSEVLDGTPDLIAVKLKARYEPLRDSRAHAEPELHQRKLFRGTGRLLVAGGLGVEVLILAGGMLSVGGVLFGLGVAALGGKFLSMSNAPLKFEPPEPLENLAALSQGLGFCRELEKGLPQTRITFDPINFSIAGSCDGYDWTVEVDREGLKVLPREQLGYDAYAPLGDDKGDRPAAGRVWRRTSSLAARHRIFWVVTIAGDFTPRPGQPSTHTSLEHREAKLDKTELTFTLPINQPDQNGLGHEGRTDFISAPLGLHHPEFVGEQIALSLLWLFKPRL